jgi:hypothetical protein
MWLRGLCISFLSRPVHCTHAYGGRAIRRDGQSPFGCRDQNPGSRTIAWNEPVRDQRTASATARPRFCEESQAGGCPRPALEG